MTSDRPPDPPPARFARRDRSASEARDADADVPPESALERFELSGEGFEDLPPGAYLHELRAGVWNVVWAGANLLAVVAAGVARGLEAISPESGWWLQAKVTWVLAPVSALLCIVVTVWQSRVSRGGSRSVVRWALIVSILALVARVAFAELLDVEYSSPSADLPPEDPSI